ncbi:hypothetical protein [Desulfovibrio sp. UCD-KL4C]|uniref:hypothetical protein n=1 Tax=Desulfovibrio sp. UCD-KL4C TaxID=2578120 RepID=UPI0025C467BE|nr:hypothetical protein [Desulfovibrio sp. UCD-KL4C]
MNATLDLEDEENKITIISNFTLNDKTIVENLVSKIFEQKVDAVIVDYRLQEYTNCSFNGATLVEEILRERPDFPVVYLTSYDVEAVENVKRPFLVYEKDATTNPTFKSKLLNTIFIYKNKIREAEEELMVLIKKENPTEYDRERIIELDDFLEKSLSKKSSLPKSIKESNILEELGKISKGLDDVIKGLGND